MWFCYGFSDSLFRQPRTNLGYYGIGCVLLYYALLIVLFFRCHHCLCNKIDERSIDFYKLFTIYNYIFLSIGRNTGSVLCLAYFALFQMAIWHFFSNTKSLDKQQMITSIYPSEHFNKNLSYGNSALSI